MLTLRTPSHREFARKAIWDGLRASNITVLCVESPSFPWQWSLLLRGRTNCDLLLGSVMRTRILLQQIVPLLATAALVTVLGGQVIDTKDWTTADDHKNMMEQLGVKALRPGPSG